MKKIILIVSFIVISAGGYFGYQALSNQEGDFSFVEAAKGDIEQVVSVTGTVISTKEIDLEFETSGQIRSILIEEGEEAKNGQTLVSLDISELNAQLRSDLAALEMAQAKLAKTIAGNRPEEIQILKRAVEKAQAELASKEKALVDAQADAINGLKEAYEDALDAAREAATSADEALDIAYVSMRNEYFNNNKQLSYQVRDRENNAKRYLSEADEALALAEEDSSYANIDSAMNEMKTVLNSIRGALAFLRSAFEDSSVSGSVSSTDEATVDTQRRYIDDELTNLTTAGQAIESVKITNQTNLNSAQDDLEIAQASLEKAQDELTLKEAGPRRVDIDFSEAEVRQAQAKVSQTRTKINKLILEAPFSGVVTKVEKEAGERVSAGEAIISMINSGRFQIKANISETDIAKVSLNNRAEMTLDALGPDEIFYGRVVKINPAETVISGVIYYQITAVFEQEDKRIKPGMTVNLDIGTDSKNNVLYLPYYLIQEENGDQYVRLLEDGQKEKRTIETGLEGETRVEIISGLEEGEKVIVDE